MKLLKLCLSIIIIIASVILCHQIIANSISNQQNKNDYAELNHIKYGLLNVEEWKRQITVILDEEINRLSLSIKNEKELRKQVEILLTTLMDAIDKRIKQENSGSVLGWFKQAFINTFINMEDLKKGIPQYADAIIHELAKSKTRDRIKTLLNKQIEQYSSLTFHKLDTTKMSGVLLRTGSSDIQSARIKLNQAISLKHDRIVKESVALVLLSVILFGFFGFSRQPLTPLRYVLLVVSLLLLLTAGVTTPAIDLEAKISKMSFVLMGHPVSFENQVFYFQSKSILDVFWIMIVHKDFQMKFVGILLITFSIIFPLLKIVSTFGYYFNCRGARENPIITFFVLKSGKWSMADVMVVAIFMAYIGFNGIIDNQFVTLSSSTPALELLNTNGTSLQPGYYLFLAYTLLALFLSEFLTREPHILRENVQEPVNLTADLTPAGKTQCSEEKVKKEDA